MKRIIKKILNRILILIILVGICVGSFYAYRFYRNVYLPKKHLNEACLELEKKWAEADTIEKQKMALQILTKNTSWGYENVSDISIQKIFVAPKREYALKLIENSAYRGNARSQFQMGLLYSKGVYYVDIDYTKAAYWWNEAALNGYIAGYRNLGWAYEYGKGVKKNEEKAIEYYTIAAESNDAWSLYHLGELYETGVTIVSGYHYEQYKTYKKQDFTVDEYVKYVCGYGRHEDYYVYRRQVPDYKTVLPKNLNKTRELWERAAVLGNEDAKEKLQRIFE